MRADEFHSGAHWAYREKRALGTPASMVLLVMWVPPNRKAPHVESRHLDGDLTGQLGALAQAKSRAHHTRHAETGGTGEIT